MGLDFAIVCLAGYVGLFFVVHFNEATRWMLATEF